MLSDESAIAIRPALLRDLDTLVAIDTQCFPPGIAYPREEIAALLRSPAAMTLVAQRGESLAGFAALAWSRDREDRCGELITIDVLPQFRREGVGHRLHRELEDWLRAGGGAGIQLHVSVDNAAALNFYRRLGYRVLGRVPKYYLNRLDAWRMKKALSQ